MRKSEIKRKTNETDIQLGLCLEGIGKAEIDTGCGFFDHMLTLFAGHGGFDLSVKCAGDTRVDYHHSVEDTGICLGMAFAQALGEMRGIARYGSVILPMDEALILVAVDISGRGLVVCDLNIPTEKVGEFDTQLTEEFFLAFARKANITLHIQQLSGANSHHIIEGAFKAFARALRAAAALDGSVEIPSTKGVL